MARLRRLTFALFLVAVSSASDGQEADGSAPKELSAEQCDALRWTGLHESTWGFTFAIPEGLVGQPNSPACTYHGVFIPLSPEPSEPGRHIDMFAGYNALFAASAQEACTRDLAAGERVLRREAITLGGEPGYRTVLAHAGDSEGSPYTTDTWCFLRPRVDPRYSYRFSLQSPPRFYAVDEVTFRRLLEELRWTKPER